MRIFLKTCYVAILALAGFTAISFSAYQQQWFSSYVESTDNTVSFTCAQQCFLMVGPLWYYDLLSLKGTMQGDGQVWYGFLVGQQVFPWDVFPAQGMTQKTFSFSTHPVFSQLPGEGVQVVLLVNGNVEAAGLSLGLMKLSFWQKISQWWKDFWTNEPLRPYSINLRYGVKVLWTPLVKIAYRIFGIVFLWALFFVRHAERRHTIILASILILVTAFSLRNLINRTSWTQTVLQSYTNAPEDQKTFYDLGDYPLFIKKMRETLQLDDKFGKGVCTTYFDAAQEWPFKVHADTVYNKPCDPALDKISADYVVYYKKPIDADKIDKPVLLEFNNSFLIQNK